jgi:phage host-nuclease inhibitor protein Gam
MTKARIKIKLPTITTRDEAEAVMNDLAWHTINQRKLTNQRDAEVLAINKKYEASLAACDEAIKEKSEALRAWAEATPDVFPKGRKSLDLVSGTLGFRTGTPKLALLSRAWNWDKVLAALRVGAVKYIRRKEEVDKDAILGANLPATAWQPFGVKIVQEESFFVEPKLTDQEARQTVKG